MNKAFNRIALATAAMGAVVSAHADDLATQATSAIAAQTVSAVAILGAFITAGIAVWGAGYIQRRFFPKGR